MMREKTFFKIWIIMSVINIIFVLFVFSYIIAEVEHQNSQIYHTKIIELDNNNFLEYADVQDYLCDNGVYAIYHKRVNMFYASTWEYDHYKDEIKVSKGRCFIKYRSLE